MPAVSKNQQIVMAIAEHDPSKLYKKNRGLLKMSHQQLHDFAHTKRSGLPTVVKHFSKKKKEK
jgi:hypothetical protein